MNFHCTFIVEKISQRYINNASLKEGQVPILNRKEAAESTKNDEMHRKLKKKESKENPTKMIFWVDKNWEAVWLDACNVAADGVCAIFQMQTLLNKLPCCTLTPQRADTVNTNVKMQFFTPHAIDNTNMPDFRFMSACPLQFFMEKRQTFRLGLWNYNLPNCDSTGKPLNQYLLTIINHDQCIIPPRIQKEYLPYVPSPHHHAQVVGLGHWIESMMTRRFPSENTIFKVLRTYCRGAWMTTFFFDLHKLYETREGTNLPPIIALYIVCNACIVHQINMEDLLFFLHAASSKNPVFQSDSVDYLLTIVRDIIMCFTLCTREGKYRDDQSLGEIVEDQPFSFAARPGDNVFDEDDCEGHNQQGCVHIKGLFQHIAKDFRENQLKNVRQHIAQTKDSCLQVNDDEIEILLMISVELGLLFDSKILDAILCAGEANFACFTEVMTSDGKKKEKPPEGHSFGLLLYRDVNDLKHIRGARVLETTGWENRSLRPISASANNKKIYNDIVQMARSSPVNTISTQTVITESVEDRLYVRVFSGDDCIFFTWNNGTLSFGAKPSHISKHAVIYAGESNEQVKDLGPLVVLMVTPEQFFQSLACHDSPWGYQENSSGKLEEYLAIKQKYPSFHKCLMTPQITEQEFLEKITKSWGKITTQNLITSCEPHDAVSTNFWLSCKVDTTTRNYSHRVKKFIQMIQQKATVKEHDFMQSKIICITPFSKNTDS